jgi:hypothetical protein
MKLRTRLVIGSALTCALTCALASAAWAAQAPAPAEIVFVNGKVFTADAQDRMVQGFAVTGDRFVAIGTNAAVRHYVGPRTRVIDLKSRFVRPASRTTTSTTREEVPASTSVTCARLVSF